MGSELGPFTSKQLLEMARSHQIMPDDSVKKGADGTWVAAHRVQGLFDDPSGSSIIMAHLPPEVKQAVKSKPEPAKAAAPHCGCRRASDSVTQMWPYKNR